MSEDKQDLQAAAPRTACPRCIERGKTWQGDNPSCAFPVFALRGEEAEFSVGNWMCATMNALRDLAEVDGAAREYSEDQYAALLPDDGGFLVLGWYKRRGRTEFAGMLSGDTMNPFMYGDAARILRRSAATAAEPPSEAVEIPTLPPPSDSKG